MTSGTDKEVQDPMSTPRGTTAPAREYRSGVRRNSTTSLISDLAPA